MATHSELIRGKQGRSFSLERPLTFEQELGSLLPRLRRFAHSLSKTTADADDLTQMTAERALSRCAQWQEGTRLDSWLYRIMRNLWIDTARQRSRQLRVEAPGEEGLNIGADPRAGMDARIDLQRVMAVMAMLPDEQREVIALVLIEGHGYQETADILEVPVGTVSSRLARGRTALLYLLDCPARRNQGQHANGIAPHMVSNSTGASGFGGWNQAQPALN